MSNNLEIAAKIACKFFAAARNSSEIELIRRETDRSKRSSIVAKKFYPDPTYLIKGKAASKEIESPLLRLEGLIKMRHYSSVDIMVLDVPRWTDQSKKAVIDVADHFVKTGVQVPGWKGKQLSSEEIQALRKHVPKLAKLVAQTC